MHTIPLYCIEEHHEAFYVWGEAVAQGYLLPSGNVLFHVDHHEDMECGGYFHRFTAPFADLDERRAFTYEKLGIADFIVPALYEGIFCTMYMMKSLVSREFRGECRYIKRVGDCALVMGSYIPFVHAQLKQEGDARYAFFTYHEGSLSSTGALAHVALDIDLDYFSWDDQLQSTAPKRIEITRDAYLEWKRDCYHPFRILPRRLLFAEEADGRYYLCYREPPIGETLADLARIEQRIERFFAWLGGVGWTPCMITMCRSARSGYLPGACAAYVEERVIGRLEQLYHIKYEAYKKGA